MLHFIQSIQPLLLVVLLLAMYVIENIWPRIREPHDRWRHDLHNIALALSSVFVAFVMTLAVSEVISFASARHWGLLRMFEAPSVLKIALGVALIDLGNYLNHRLMHASPLLWRIHRVHHSDDYLNATTALRFHPLESVYSIGLYLSVMVIVVGISIESYVIYGTLGIILLSVQHGNYHSPTWVEKYGSLVFCTPEWHKVHHSSYQPDTDSHFGNVFSVWDRMAGTWHRGHAPVQAFGLDVVGDRDRVTAWFLLRLPFRDV